MSKFVSTHDLKENKFVDHGKGFQIDQDRIGKQHLWKSKCVDCHDFVHRCNKLIMHAADKQKKTKRATENVANMKHKHPQMGTTHTGCLTSMFCFLSGDKHGGKLPVEFPRIFAMDSANTGIVHPECQSNANKIPKEFVCFCEHFLPNVDTKRKSRFTMEERTEKTVREMHSISVKVFSLMVLHNKLDAWDSVHPNERKTRLTEN